MRPSVAMCPEVFGSDAYFGLLLALQDLLGRGVDLVEPGAIKNPYFLESVNESREAFYAA